MLKSRRDPQRRLDGGGLVAPGWFSAVRSRGDGRPWRPGQARHAGSAEAWPGAQNSPSGSRRGWAAVVAAREHALFCSALVVAAVVRVFVMLGYPPALWFSDSLPYIQATLKPGPVRVRPR